MIYTVLAKSSLLGAAEKSRFINNTAHIWFKSKLREDLVIAHAEEIVHCGPQFQLG